MRDFHTLLRTAQQNRKSWLCVGLDPEPSRLPEPWRNDRGRLFDFCAAIADATYDLVCAFKPQIAYFSAVGAEAQLERLMDYLFLHYPEVPVILDAKRGDIGSTAQQYAREAFERYRADATTVSPYLGWDAVEPYLRYRGKTVFVLCRTSNASAADLQGASGTPDATTEPLYWRVARLAQRWDEDHRSRGHGSGIGLVVGATYPQELREVRALAPQLPLLIPGIGAQGGDLARSIEAAQGGAIINSSRAILYAGDGTDFATRARDAALSTRDAMRACIEAAGLTY